MSKDRINWDKVKWTDFKEASYSRLSPEMQQYKEDVGARLYLNSIYQVEYSVVNGPPPFGRIIYLSLKTKDKQPRHDWREMQRIKNDLVGEEVEAVEVYPAESRLVDTSNQYHLFCFPELQFERGRLPFGYPDRLVAEGSSSHFTVTGKGARQKDFRLELKPKDLVRGEAIEKAVNAGQPIVGSCPHCNVPFVMKDRARLGDVWFVRGECLKGLHVVLLADKEAFDGAGKEGSAGGHGSGDATDGVRSPGGSSQPG